MNVGEHVESESDRAEFQCVCVHVCVDVWVYCVAKHEEGLALLEINACEFF